MTLPQNSAPEVHAAEIDVMSDWVDVLGQLRDKIKELQEKEKDAKDKVQGFLAERGAEYGTINGRIAVRSQHMTRRYAPSVSTLEKVAPEILEQYGKTTTFTQLVLVKD